MAGRGYQRRLTITIFFNYVPIGDRIFESGVRIIHNIDNQAYAVFHIGSCMVDSAGENWKNYATWLKVVNVPKTAFITSNPLRSGRPRE